MPMRICLTVTAVVLAGLAIISAGAEPQARIPQLRFQTGEGKVRIQGSSVVHDWQAETRDVRGFVEVGADFPVIG